MGHPTGSSGRGIGREAQADLFSAGISGTRPRVPTDPSQLEAAARKALPEEAFAYIAGGAGAGRTVVANREAFARWQIWPRVLKDVSARDLSTTLLGQKLPAPLLLAPLGVMELADPGADVAVARAAAATGVPYVQSNQASIPMEYVARQAPGSSRMFQLYWSASDDLNRSLLARPSSGCTAIVVTLDTHLLGWAPRIRPGYCRSCAGSASPNTPPTPCSELVAQARGTARGESGPTVRSPGKRWPGPHHRSEGIRAHRFTELRENLRSPLPRAAVKPSSTCSPRPRSRGRILPSAEWTRCRSCSGRT